MSIQTQNTQNSLRFSGVYLKPEDDKNRKASTTGHEEFSYTGKSYYTTNQDTLTLRKARKDRDTIPTEQRKNTRTGAIYEVLYDNPFAREASYQETLGKLAEKASLGRRAIRKVKSSIGF